MAYKLFRVTNIEDCVEQDFVLHLKIEEAKAWTLTSEIEIVEEMTFAEARHDLERLLARLQYLEGYIAGQKAKAAKFP